MIGCTRSFRNSAAALAVAGATFAAAPAGAEQANINSMSFDTEGYYAQIHVISTDGVTWDKLKSGSVAFSGHMKLDTKWPGYVGEVAIVLGVCGPGQCHAYPKVWNGIADSRDYDNTEIVGFNTSIIPVSTDGIAIVPYGDQILARCNEHLQADGPTKSYSFSQTFDATFAAETGKILDMDNTIYEASETPLHPVDESHTAHGTFQVAVTCDPVIKSPTDDLAHDFGEFDVTDVKLFLTTFQPGHPGSNPGTVCPGFRVTSRAQANQAGPVTMRLWRQKDGGPITSEVQQAWASFDPVKNGYFATWQKWENVGTTSWFQFRTEIVDNAVFPPFDGWKDITVHCTGAGGGGLAPVPQADPDEPQASWQGKVLVPKIIVDPAPKPKVIVAPAPKCLPSQRLLLGRCVDRPLVTACGRNERRIDGRCVKIPGVSIHCLPGWVQKGLKCVKKPVIASACKRNEIRVDGKCVKKPVISILCKKGFKLVGKTCVRIPTLTKTCRPWEKLVRGNCVGKLPVVKKLGAKKPQLLKSDRSKSMLLKRPAKKTRRVK